MGLFSNAKDRLVERAALGYLNSKWLSPYGQATDLRIDSKAKTITIEAELKGEMTPLRIDILDYEITRDGERYWAVIKQIQTSREWLTTLANDRLVNVRFQVPSQVGGLLMATL